jgi:hypothetical protein
MPCEIENWQARAAFSDIIDTLKLHSQIMDYLEMELVNAKVGTKKEKNLEDMRTISEEVYDRLHDLADMVNVKENEPIQEDKRDDPECDDDNCDCHQ